MVKSKKKKKTMNENTVLSNEKFSSIIEEEIGHLCTFLNVTFDKNLFEVKVELLNSDVRKSIQNFYESRHYFIKSGIKNDFMIYSYKGQNYDVNFIYK